MAYFNIPLTGNNQKINVALGGTTYKLRLIFRSQKWFLDVLDTAENPVILAIPMVMGDDLLVQHQHVLQGSLYVVNMNDDEAQNFSDLGDKITLYWSDS
ncbi:phage baseplate plug family protein [Acinetobacter rathckeae]|uniref:phage baseplate plug family protein n=1 Tax=Acinetobacter rathckeae TaxID=2605272 RepID=UPI0018A2B2A0|nr:hypothetical protein [Acinetobacter rathckeae]MBF7687087.1 hypothetical protein [Acinetobacter rathckeae]